MRLRISISPTICSLCSVFWCCQGNDVGSLDLFETHVKYRRLDLDLLASTCLSANFVVASGSCCAFCHFWGLCKKFCWKPGCFIQLPPNIFVEVTIKIGKKSLWRKEYHVDLLFHLLACQQLNSESWSLISGSHIRPDHHSRIYDRMKSFDVLSLHLEGRAQSFSLGLISYAHTFVVIVEPLPRQHSHHSTTVVAICRRDLQICTDILHHSLLYNMRRGRTLLPNFVRKSLSQNWKCNHFDFVCFNSTFFLGVRTTAIEPCRKTLSPQVGQGYVGTSHFRDSFGLGQKANWKGTRNEIWWCGAVVSQSGKLKNSAARLLWIWKFLGKSPPTEFTGQKGKQNTRTHTVDRNWSFRCDSTLVCTDVFGGWKFHSAEFAGHDQKAVGACR